MRSGRQRVQQPDSSPESDSNSDKGYSPCPRQKKARTTQKTRQPRLVPQEVASQGPQITHKRKRHRLNDEDNQINDTAPDTSMQNSQNELPTLMNYQELGLHWGMARAEQRLSDLKVPKTNRLSPSGLFEAQSLQSQYQLHKTMLCITLKCSRKVLDEALLEGPLAREPNMYTNYQTYSVTATATQMPAKGVSEGFGERNAIVGNTWSSYDRDEQDVFTPRLFEPLCMATSEEYSLTQNPLGILPATQPPESSITPASTITPAPGLNPLTNEELDKYLPIFKRLVNLKNVSRDMHEGRLWRHSGKSKTQSLERLMMHEISKTVRQLHALKNHFNLHFHLLVACWNPASPTSRALFQDEHTSCERWARLQQKKHLLECFAFEATKAPENIRPKVTETKPPSKSAVRQAQLRADLVLALNNLIAPYLRSGYIGKGDAHPKIGNLATAFEKKTFRGDIKLTFQRTPDSDITDTMLEKGTSALTNDEVTIWLNDIQSNKYTIVKVDKPKPSVSKSQKLRATSTPQDTENDTKIFSV